MGEGERKEEFELEKLRQFSAALLISCNNYLNVSESARHQIFADASKNGMHFERFTFVKVLGFGSFGRVIKATLNNKGTQDVAIKLINPHKIRTGPISNPLAEVDILRKVKGRRGFLQIIGAFVHINPIIVTQLATGALNEVRPLKSPTVIRLACQLIDGLAFLERGRIVHGDIKPANILLTSSSNVLISDFGCSVVLKPGQEHYQHHRNVGTLNYAHYQAVINYRMSHRTDVFSLGVSLYNLVTSHSLIMPDASVRYPTPQHIAETQIYGRVSSNNRIVKYTEYIRSSILNISLQNLILSMTDFNKDGTESGIPLASTLLTSEVLQQAKMMLKDKDVWDGSCDRIIVPCRIRGRRSRRFAGLEFFDAHHQDAHMLELARTFYYEERDSQNLPGMTDRQTQTEAPGFQLQPIQSLPKSIPNHMAKSIRTDDEKQFINHADFSNSKQSALTPILNETSEHKIQNTVDSTKFKVALLLILAVILLLNVCNASLP